MAADKLTEALTNVTHASRQAGRSAVRRWLGKPGSKQRRLISDLRGLAEEAVAPVDGYLKTSRSVRGCGRSQIEVCRFAQLFNGGVGLWFADGTVGRPLQFRAQDQAAAGRAVWNLQALVWATAEGLEKLTPYIDPKAFVTWLALAQLLLCPLDLSLSAAALVEDLNVVGVGEIGVDGAQLWPSRHSNHRIDNSMLVLLNAYRESLGLARIRQPTKKSTKARKASPGRVSPAPKVPTNTLTARMFSQIRSMTPGEQAALPAALLEIYKRMLKERHLD